MPRKKWRRDQKNKHKQKKENGGGESNDAAKEWKRDSAPWQQVQNGNFKFEAYYAYLGIHNLRLQKENVFVENETEQEQQAERLRWTQALKDQLPAAFRIGQDVDESLRESLVKELEGYVGKKLELTIELKGGTGPENDKKEEPPQPVKKWIAPAQKLPYIPYGYQLSLDRRTIRRNPSLNKFHAWLKIQTEAGFITRQETVSMIPPVVLDPQPHHMVLDMCAAPGSKTSQLLEMVNRPTHPGDSEPTGVVIANDSDAKRAYLLVHQMRRINSPAIFITNCDAQYFPLLRDDEHPTEGLFDRVLCDVPCSGDGTARKNPGIWKRWNQMNAMGLHVLQLSIGLKGARLTKVGGYLCYSTCSMNPTENESVVAELLRVSEGALELVDRCAELDGLLARPGMSNWKVCAETKNRTMNENISKKKSAKMKAKRKLWEANNSANGDAATENGGESAEGNDDDEAAPRVKSTDPFDPKTLSEEELKQAIIDVGMMEYKSVDDVPANLRRRIRPSVFPPTPAEAKSFHLERCMRIMPQDMDTGGFFVALLKKVAPMNAHARELFENLQNELKETVSDSDEKPIDETTKNNEPPSKKAKKSTDESSATNLGEDANCEERVSEDKASEETAFVSVEKNSDGVARGHVKKNYLKDKDGKKHQTLGRDDYIPVPDDIFAPLRDFYGLNSSSFEEGQYMIRAGGDTKKLYFVTKRVKKLIDDGVQERVTMISTGLKGFIRNNKLCRVHYRVCQEGVHFVAPHMTKRKLCADFEDFKKCISPAAIDIKGFSDDFAKQIRDLEIGSFVVTLNGYEDDYIKKLVLVMWRCRADNVDALICQADIDGMLSKLRSVSGETELKKEDGAAVDAET